MQHIKLNITTLRLSEWKGSFHAAMNRAVDVTAPDSHRPHAVRRAAQSSFSRPATLLQPCSRATGSEMCHVDLM